METRTEVHEKPFPDDLEGRVSAVLNAINTELKTATLLHLDNNIAEGSTILSRIRQTVGNWSYLPHQKAFSAYCSRSLLPIGLVAKETVLSEGEVTLQTGYRITEAGKKYGLPVAMLALDWVKRNNTSLFNVFGQTASRGDTRAPINRFNLLKYLNEVKKPVIKSDISKAIGLNGDVVLYGLRALSKTGFIDFKSAGNREERKQFKYQYTEKDAQPEAVLKCPQLTLRVYEALKTNKEISASDLAKKLNYPRVSDISVIIRGLSAQGFVRAKKWHGGTRPHLSEIKITEKGKEFADNFIVPFSDILGDREALATWTKRYEDRLTGTYPLDLRNAIECYRAISPQINKKESSERLCELDLLIEGNPGKTTNELINILKVGRGISFRYLSQLIKQGKIRVENPNGVCHYYPNS